MIAPAGSEKPKLVRTSTLGVSALDRVPKSSSVKAIAQAALFPIEWVLYRLPLHLVLASVVSAASVVSWPLGVIGHLRSGHSFSAFALLILGGPLCLLHMFLAIVGAYDAVLSGAADQQIGSPLITLLLEAMPWPQGHNGKVMALAKARRVVALQRMLRMKEESEQAEAKRMATQNLWMHFDRAADEEEQCSVLRDATSTAEALALVDINHLSSSGSSMFNAGARIGHPQVVRALTKLGADPNNQDESGESALHSVINNGFINRESEMRPVIALLLTNPDLNPCLYNNCGNTPYMSVKKPQNVAMLVPKLAWETIELALSQVVVGGEAASALTKLVSQNMKLLELRIPDLLFCQHEGDEVELARRRRAWWDLLLKPMTAEAAVRKLSKEEKSVVIYAWEASMGPKRLRNKMRTEYAGEMQQLLRTTMGLFEAELAPVREAMLQDTAGKTIAERPAVELKVPATDLRHSRFLDCKKLFWAVNRDLAAACRELERVGAVNSVAEVCDLLSLGVSPLSPRPRRDLFCDTIAFGDSPEWIDKSKYYKTATTFSLVDTLKLRVHTKLAFWQALVALWILALHKQLKPIFDETLASVASQAELHPGPLKPLARILEKTNEYITEKGLTSWSDKVIAPLYVIDILRATVQVPTALRACEVETRLIESMALARAKNGHSLEVQTAVGGYRDQKLNLVISTMLPIGKVDLLCEVQVWMS